MRISIYMDIEYPWASMNMNFIKECKVIQKMGNEIIEINVDT